MKLTLHASSSKGNVVQIDNTVIDAGINLEWQKINCERLLITHGHIDHIKYIKRALKHCRTFYAPDDVIDYLYERIGRWTDGDEILTLMDHKYSYPSDIESIPLNHDVPCSGYVVGDYVHIVDTGYPMNPIPRGKTLYGIESNYDSDELATSNRPDDLKIRIQKTHMSNTEACRLADELQAKHVIFMHLSDETNSPSLLKAEYSLEPRKFKPIWIEPGDAVEFKRKKHVKTYHQARPDLYTDRPNTSDTAARGNDHHSD